MTLENAALLIIDMINEFVHPEGKLFVPGAPASVPRLAAVLAACRRTAVSVIHVVRQHRPDGSDVESVRQEAFRHLGGFCLPGSWGTQVIPELAPLPEEVLLIKRGWSAFQGTGLQQVLRRLGRDTLIIGGTQTPNCIRATIYDATALGYQTILLQDGTSSASTEVQEANLHDMAALGVPIAACADIIAALEQGHPRPRRSRASLRPVRPAEQATFTRTVLETIREGDLLLDAVLRIPFVAWWTYRVLDVLYHRRSQALVLEVDRAGAGFLVLRPAGDALRIEALGVSPPFRGQGWGEWLLEQAEEQARQAGLERLELYVSSGNTPALRLYARAGFFPIPRLWSQLRLERQISLKEAR